MKLYNTPYMELIDIKDISGSILLTTLPDEGCKRKFTLMKEDYILLKFSLESPIFFKLGSYVECDFGMFEVCDLQKPVFNANTAGYDYELQLDAYYWKWKNKIFKYTPEVAGQEASWNLTASLDVQAGIVLRNLKALGYKYKGQDFVFSIDSTVENKALLMTYDNINILDACFSMAKKWDCECWVTENIINFGRCEYGTPVDFEIGDNVVEMTSSESKSTYATRIYAFGSTRNISSNYRPVDESIVVNGVVQKRLMLPEGTPYIDAYPDMSTEEAVEQVVVFDDIYPRTDGHISKVITYTDTVNNEDGTQTTETFYQFTDTGITFSKDYILEGEELHIIFQSGSLNGMDFGVTFNPMGEPERNEDGSWNPKAQLWEIVANEDYGRKLPDDVLKPKEGDTYILYGWDSSKIADLGLVSAAEQELKEKAEEYVAKSRIDPNTYSCTMMSDYMYGLDEGGNQNPDYAKHFDVGDKVNLVNSAFFESGNRQSRIIGYECNLDKPYDSPVYTVGETASYSRIGELEEQIENITLKGQTYTGGGGSGIYVIGTNDTTSPTNRNVYSALRVLQSFLSKTTNDRTPFKLEVGDKLTAEKGLQISKNFVPGIIGGSGGSIYLDENGKVVIETDKAVFREELIVPQITFNCIDVISGDKANTFAYGTIKTVDTENRIATLDLLEGQYGTLHVSDICRGIFHNIGGSNTDKDTLGANGFIEYSGYATSYFTPTNILENEAGSMKLEYELQVGTNVHPMPGMNFFAYGNFEDKDRQAITYENRYYTRRLAHVNTWVIDPEVNIMMQTGDLTGLSIGGMDFSGYSFYGKNVYISGTIERLKPNGTPAKDLSYEGPWESGRKYDYYDSVTHDGSTWACMNKNGSSAEPGTNNDWQKIASKGDKGDPGESAVFADLTNEMDNVTLTNDGKVYQDTSIDTVVWMSYGTKKMTLTGITCTLPANVTETHDVSTGEITFSVKQGVALDGRNSIPIALTATYGGKTYTGQLTFTLAGVKGGADAVLYRLVPSVSAVIKDANGNLNVTSVSCTRLKSSVSGGTAETGTGELKYSLDGGAEVSIGNNAGVPVSSFQKSIKFIFYVDGTVVDVETIPLVVDGKDGAQGPQGVPGPAGADGKTLYTWIKYADDAQGGGISNNPTGKAYIGFAYNKETATESNDPSDYTWSDIKGEDGIPGAAGADGKTYYTWVAYSDNADGTGMYQQPKDTTKYIGIAVNKETATESSDPSDYTWSKFKGEDGQSVSSLGRWYTGLIVPKLGIVTMGGSTFCAKKETTNPPLWTTTTSDGRRITQTQDGGKTYGYILSGESNTEEYDLLVQSGKDGSDGTDHERVFIHTTEENRPSTPATSQTDDYIPSGWHDDPIGVSESLPFEWVSEREKKNGVWGNFSTPALWAKYGFDGKGVKYVDVLYAISTSNTTAPTTGWQTDAPAWENGKYIWSKTVTTYSDDSVEETSPVCITGGAGATGKGVKTITEYYYMSTSPTTLTGGSWSTTRPTWENGKYIWTKSIITYTDNTTSETPGICVTGEKGDSITSLGRWYTGLIVPKQGVVNMGGSSYIAKKETTNPPLWTVTTSSGQRIKQTQDGGKTYGYILSGEMNSAEYDLLASKGEDGKPGADGKPGTDGKPGEKGEQGIQGCIIRHSKWAAGVTYRNDEALTSGTRYLDIAMIENLATIDGWDVYRCKTTHTSSTSNKPGNTTYWEKLSNEGPIFTSLIIAKNASIDFMQGNQLLIKKDDGTVTAGLSGSIAGSKVRIWAGAHEPDDAPFRVLESGKMIGTDVELTGTINAISGTIAGFKISGTSISSTDGAYDGGAGNNSYSNSKFFLHADGSSSAFLGFSATNKWVGIGLNCMPATSNMQVLGRFEDTGTSAYTYNKAGLYISIAGATTYDDSNVHGNSALYIPKGHITGFRRRFRRVSTSTTLTNMDSIVRLVNTAEITVTLPAGCEDGQEIWLCSGNEKKVNVTAASGDTITGSGGSFASNRWHIYIYDAHNRDWVYGYTNWN